MEVFKYLKSIIVFGLIFACYCFLTVCEYSKKQQIKRSFMTRHTHQKISKKTPVNITLNDIFISVKTSKRFETTRLPIILKTWFQFAKEQTWFFTDKMNQKLLQNETNGHIINTKCSPWHDRKGLNCKMAAELNHYIRSGKKWFCHFDDDNYVNVFRLISLLRKYDYRYYWYLGKKSIKGRVPVTLLRSKYLVANGFTQNKVRLAISFATGGAGFCISQSLAKIMLPIAAGDIVKGLCGTVGCADDVCVGLIIRYATLKNPVKLTKVNEFHSHLERLNKIKINSISDQISLSYKSRNVLNIPEYELHSDPSRFLYLHCLLFPDFGYCRNKGNNTDML